MHGSVLLIRDYFLSSCITWARLTDIGVGTGYYLKHAPATHAISLMDLNPDSLKIAASRVGNTKNPRHTTTRCFRHVPGGLARALRFRFDVLSSALLTVR